MNRSHVGSFNMIKLYLGTFQSKVRYSKLSNKTHISILFNIFYFIVLASWFRLKYPHIAYGALAASAPLFYFKGLTPEKGFALVVSSDFNVSKLNISLQNYVDN